MEIAGLLREQGMIVVGPAASLDCARQLLRAGGFDVALVDVSLHGEPATDVLAALRLAEVPFALCTGLDREDLPPGHDKVPILAKPFLWHELIDTLVLLCTQTAQARRRAG